MSQEHPAKFFDKERAEIYDKQRVKMAPIKDALHFFMKAILNDLPDDANVLCVGVGTGAELLMLAEAFPNWRFTAVEPASDMMAICKEKMAEEGFADRCSFHEGYVDTLEVNEAFDAATSILVAHFITDRDDRIAYYSDIATRLKKGGTFINADLSVDMDGEGFEGLFDTWITMARIAGMPETELANYRAMLGTKVVPSPASEVEQMLIESGFQNPIAFYQAMLIHY